MSIFVLGFLSFTYLSAVSSFTSSVMQIANLSFNFSYVPNLQFPCQPTKYSSIHNTCTQSCHVTIQIGNKNDVIPFQLHTAGNASTDYNQLIKSIKESIDCQEEQRVQISTENKFIPCTLMEAQCKTTHYSDICHAIVVRETRDPVRNCTVVKLQLEFDTVLSTRTNIVAVVIFIIGMSVLLLLLVLVFYLIQRKQSPSNSPLPKASDSTTVLDASAVSSFSHSNQLRKGVNMLLVQPPSNISKTVSKSTASPSPTNLPSSLVQEQAKLQKLAQIKTPAQGANPCPSIYEKALQRESALARGKFSRGSCSSATSSGTGTDSSTVHSIGELLQAARNIKITPPVVKCDSTSILKTINTDIPKGPIACTSPRAEQETQKDMKSNKISNWPIYFMKSLLRKKRRERQSRMGNDLNL